MNNYYSVLVITDEAPVCGDLFGARFGFNVINNFSDMLLKRFRLKVRLTEWTEGVYPDYDLVTVLTEHNRERVELAVKRTDRIDGTTARLRFKERTDIEIVMGF